MVCGFLAGAACATSPADKATSDEAVGRAAIQVFGHTAEPVDASSSKLLLDLAAAPDPAKCDAGKGGTTCCAQDIPGENSPGICCTIGNGWGATCIRVACKADGNCYDPEP